MHIALNEDLERLLKKWVENGQFPNEEVVVREALTRFLIEEPSRGGPRTRLATEILEERLPGPFIEDPMVLAPVELSSGREDRSGHSGRGPRRCPSGANRPCQG